MAASTTSLPPGVHGRGRAKEFHKYYGPVRALLSATPPWTDLNDERAVARHRPALSPDKALTAFCQLAAIRLDVRRAMLFFFDSERGYVLAEATRSLSFKGDANAEDGDRLWLGHTTIPLGFSVCEHTVNLPVNHGSNRDSSNAGMVHVVNDLSSDTRFCDRPFVSAGPCARFYAGVPVTTPAGINIGALCVMDDRPRDRLLDPELDLLTDLRDAVMAHLEGMRATAACQRGNVMLTGLNSFLDETVDLQSCEGTPACPPLGSLASTIEQAGQCALQASPFRDASDSVGRPSERSVKPQERSASVNSRLPEDSGADVKVSYGDMRTCTGRDDLADKDADEKPGEGAKRVLQLAASKIQKAMNADGVIFYDASRSNFDIVSEDLVRSQHSAHPMGSGGGSDTDTACEETPASLRSSRSGSPPSAVDQPCSLLAAAFPDATTHQHPARLHMTRPVLQSLTRRYNGGKIWHLPHDHDASDDPSASLSTAAESQSPGQPQQKRRRRTRLDDLASLRHLFPEAQSLMFLPVWDHATDRWYAGALVYTNSPLRSFTVDTELMFMRAFCDVVVAELARLGAQAVSKAKSTFISSISHELRTPLHGILGSVEHLHDQSLSSEVAGLVSQIETCGQTMLDIINQLLDFSRVNDIVQDRLTSMDDCCAAPLAAIGPLGRNQLIQSSMRLRPKVDLDRVTEDVIESAVYSFYCNQSSNPQDRPRVTTVLEVDRGVSADWTCRMAIGAWKRICVNLITNALRHTATGYVHITLKQSHQANTDSPAIALLTVADTGRGMSEEFMRAFLFQPFEQENPLANGTGLGLSFVARILKAMGGDISVASKQNVGTTVTVSVPLIQTRSAAPRPSQISDALSDSELDSNADARFIGPSWDPEDSQYGKGRQLLQSSLRMSIRQILARLPCSSPFRPRARVDFVAEDDLEWLASLAQQQSTTPNQDSAVHAFDRPLVILCKTRQSMRHHKSAAESLRKSLMVQVDFLVGPCGHFQVARVLKIDLGTDSVASAPPAFLNHEGTTERPKRPSLGKRRSGGTSETLSSRLQQTRAEMPPLSRQSSAEANRKMGLCSGDEIPVKAGLQQTIPRARELPFVELDAPPTPALTPLSAPTATVIPTDEFIGDGAKDDGPSGSELVTFLVDDNQINMRLLTMYVKKHRHIYRTASDGMQALKLYDAALQASSEGPGKRKGKPGNPDEDAAAGHGSGETDGAPVPWPQVVLMDISMPNMDGFEATRRIRGLEAEAGHRRRTFIIAMTSLGSETAQREATASGMDLFLTKPVRLSELTQILQSKPWIS